MLYFLLYVTRQGGNGNDSKSKSKGSHSHRNSVFSSDTVQLEAEFPSAAMAADDKNRGAGAEALMLLGMRNADRVGSQQATGGLVESVLDPTLIAWKDQCPFEVEAGR